MKSLFLNRSEILKLKSGVHTYNHPIYLDTLSAIVGEHKDSTIIKFIGDFSGPCIRSKNLEELVGTGKWFYEDGVPVRMRLTNLTIDLSEWTPNHSADNHFTKLFSQTGNYDVSKFAIAFYAKKYELANVSIKNCPNHAFYSSCSKLGGKKDFFYDSPESIIDNLEITNCNGSGFIFSGPHDSFIKSLIVSNTKAKGVDIFTTNKHNGACDIDFIHAYGNGDISIDIRAKIKARLLQGDTGTGSGVRIKNSDKSIIDTIESFKTRRKKIDSYENFSIVLSSYNTQINIIRIRADCGADGLLIDSVFNQINSISIDCRYPNPEFKHLRISRPPIPMIINKDSNFIGSYFCRGNISPAIQNRNIKLRECYLGSIMTSNNISEEEKLIKKCFSKDSIVNFI